MALFTGTYEHKVDGKGRVSLPSDFRDELPTDDSRGLYIFPSLQLGCLEACGRSYMERIVDSIEDPSEFFSGSESALTSITARARRVSLDSTGRFILLDDFSGHAGIGGMALFVGRGRSFQIWSRDNYDRHAGGGE